LSLPHYWELWASSVAIPSICEDVETVFAWLARANQDFVSESNASPGSRIVLVKGKLIEVRLVESSLYHSIVVPHAPFEPYQRAKSILFLAEGNVDSGSALAPEVARYFFEKGTPKRVVSGDISNTSEWKDENLELVHIDNRKPLAFADNTFELVVMRRGLCHCPGTNQLQGVCCGGISLTLQELTRFLLESWRVLNKADRNSGVFFLNTGGGASQNTDTWSHLAAQLMHVHPGMEAEVLIRSKDGKFDGVHLFPRY
jgi:hypothetical protein